MGMVTPPIELSAAQAAQKFGCVPEVGQGVLSAAQAAQKQSVEKDDTMPFALRRTGGSEKRKNRIIECLSALRRTGGSEK